MEIYHGGYCLVENPKIIEGKYAKEYNDLFFVCSLIEYIGRKTKNHRNVVVNAIGKDKWDIGKVYKRLLVDVCDKQGKNNKKTKIKIIKCTTHLFYF